MKIRRDAVAVSSFLFTLALLIPLPVMLGNAWTVPQTSIEITAQVAIPNYSAPIGFASLAVIVIGLIVIWTGYIKGVRWTWFVMFVVVWLWAFPVLLLPTLQPGEHGMAILLATLKSAISESGPARVISEVILAFVLMLVALVLPVKTFILGRGVGQTKPLTKR